MHDRADYTEQTSWLLFRSIWMAQKKTKGRSRPAGKKYTYILEKPYQASWAAPKGKDGGFDHNKAQTGEDLRDFVDDKLFPT
ncbi:MAG: hypothetical protein U0894_17225 [Pirellulales bacterium]